MDPANVTIGLAALAGLASFLSPCVLALVPAYVGYLGGRSVTTSGHVIENRWTTFVHGLAFVLGFSVIFVALGTAASAIGVLLYDMRTWIARLGGAVVVVFGLHTMGLIHIPFLDYDTRRHGSVQSDAGFLSSALMGVFFSAGWAPCVGPVLGTVLTLSLNSADLTRGAVLLTAYSAGMAVPFLMAAAGIGSLADLLKRHRRTIHYISVATGALLVAVGVMLMTGTLSRLANMGFIIDLGL